ncbi:dihydrolipoamide acetyltransferase family protein [Rathayibacter toxicus]|uniref:Dihydrolipoamide acetyltransferase component of pyruvate dehydrogenase complex n=1 Tax=Rathayibacter toxicus TaxID=145458 RepID=A0A0C5BCX8_9MICO|nr:dihydrolipoamide acetyltransferase family protein [Rathayibacter toxicus]AJM77011.1 branched-chain alpha-keto acid dehydrogenase subunit E2 [Rathayibacter toxicus]ALS57186.1 branched-chain alpha-keto acid dehydrogenase subunit E2 [Rathayibacter toxicus]KKM46011.1 branched-chain alpha-keto acid dehydrogenase subunit E2 [Rathayibacter toxicus]PPG22940.1 2-oxo acid dehydrogenase subunit E2 [Rathayibacter toxicus]PPG47521.1 2-oxo acid dehydrogenase subunit E2 [Rathayibacter toxicus]
MTQQFLLPDVGEGLTEAEIVAWKVAVGDEIAVNQVLVEIETAKSLVELPSPFSGIVVELLVEEGQTVQVGVPLIAVEAGGGAGGPEIPAMPAQATPVAAPSTTEPGEGSGAALVGYGTAGGHVTTRRRRASVTVPAERTVGTPPPSVPAAAALPVIAKPPIRKLAKDLGVDLLEVQATGLAGEVTRDDVIRHASQASVFRNIQTPDWADSREERIPVRGVRKAIAAAMSDSAFTAPHVSVFVDVDATRTMEFVKRLKNSPDFAGVKVSPLLIMAKAIIWAVRRNPTVNSAWTDSEIIVRHYVNLGIAAATPRGLLVPNVKDAQSMSLLELAQALEKLTLDARDGKTTPAEMQNGTITLTNIGVFGMDTGTPILNPGEVAIIALGTIKQKPWVVDGEVRPRYVTTVGGSFDHRVVDGDVVSRFVADVASVLEEPALLLD